MMKGQGRVVAIALAAGLSRRLGNANKLLLDFNGKRLFSHTLERISAADFAARIVVTNYREIEAYAAERGFAVTGNPASAAGVAGSIRAGLCAAGPAAGYMFFNCDQPLLSAAVITEILAAFYRTDKIIIPTVGGVRYSPCLFPQRFKAELLALSGDHGGKAVYKRHIAAVEFMAFAEATDFMDLDVPDDRAELLRRSYGRQPEGFHKL